MPGTMLHYTGEQGAERMVIDVDLPSGAVVHFGRGARVGRAE